MHVKQPRRPCPLVQVVDILGDDQQPALPFPIEPGERLMRGVRRDGIERCAPLVVEIEHQRPVTDECFWCADVLNGVVRPQTIRCTKCFETTLCRDASAGKHDDVFDLIH